MPPIAARPSLHGGLGGRSRSNKLCARVPCLQVHSGHLNMFAFFGLGMQEILLLAILAGMVAVIVFVVHLVARSSGGSSKRIGELEEENRRLRKDRDPG